MAGSAPNTVMSGRRRVARPRTHGSNNTYATIRRRFKAICDHPHAMRTPSSATSTRPSGVMTSYGFSAISPTVAPSKHTLDCLRRINCRHLHLIIGNHDRNFRLRSNDALYEDVFETIDDYREIDMELPVLDGSGKPTAATARQTIGIEPLPQALGIGRRTRQLAGKLEQVRRCGADHRRLAALWSYTSRHSRRHRSAQRECGA